MAEIKIAGILRSAAFSPNHIGNDAAILNMVADQLRKRGCIVNIYSEEQFLQGAANEHILMNMCREPRSIALLQQREDAGDLVINSGYGIENCTRERMTRILIGSGIPYPESIMVDTDEVVRDRLAEAGFAACWVKRGDTHTRHREDVSYARHPQEAQEILQEYFLRGMKRATVSRHLTGELIKFYGVADTPFFHWYAHFGASNSKHGPAPAASAPESLKHFDPEIFKEVCAYAADLLDVKIYGGDCIVAPDGTFCLIDLNDWPSFAPCREEVAPVIARMIMNTIRNRQHHD